MVIEPNYFPATSFTVQFGPFFFAARFFSSLGFFMKLPPFGQSACGDG